MRLADVIPGPGGRGAVLRYGRVVSVAGAALLVRVGDTQQPNVPYIVGEPLAVGDRVAVLVQGSTWLVLGRVNGGSDTFAGANWSQWSTYNAVGAATVDKTTDPDTAVVSTSGPSIDCYLLSPPVVVTTGDRWRLATDVAGSWGVAPSQRAADLLATWYADPPPAYPTTVAADTVAASVSSVSTTSTGLVGYVTVPAAAKYMRVAVRTRLNAAGSLSWATVAARKE